MDAFEELLSSLDLIGWAALVVIAGWTLLSLGLGLLRRRFNFLALSLQLFGLLFLLRDLALPYIDRWFSIQDDTEIRSALTVALIVAAAFVFDRLWRHFVWDGLMIAGGGAPAPSLLRGAFTGLVLLIATGVVTGWVYGHSITGLLAASGVAAIVVGYAAQSTLSDLLAGLAMSIAPSYRVGDILDIDGDWVQVVDQNWRVTETLRVDGRRVYYPNSVMAGRAVTTMPTGGAPLRRGFTFFADGRVPPERVRDVAVEAARQSRLCLPDKEPKMWISGHGTFGYECTLYYFPPWETYIDAQTEISNLLWYGFRRAGIAFGLNRNHLYVTDWARADAPHRDSLADLSPDPDSFLAACRATRELRLLPTDAAERLFAAARPRVLGRYERLVKAGETGESLFLLTEGRLAVHIPTDSDDTRVAELEAPALVGFMAMMTAAPRSATLVADTACRVYEIDARDFAALTDDRPELRERLIDISAEMALENEAAREEADRSAAAQADRARILREMFAARLKDLLRVG